MAEIQNFIKTIMEKDLQEGKVSSIVTRFPPEPNAYLHIGHARAIINNFELAKMFNGKTNLRFDDTNPVNEGQQYVDGIIADLKWLGYTPNLICFGSDYFEKTYEKAILLIKKGLAYVDDLDQEEITKYRGTLTEPGIESPCRNRSIEENLELFEKMRQGVFKDGEKTLRAKIDMASSNINMRDPVMYRILHVSHHRQKDKWCIYPMYDFAHPLQDSFEGVTHSLCSIEYDNHRPLYDWFIENCEMENIPHQYEFGRLNITNTIMSKRYLRQLVEGGYVTGYDDPRMPTLVGLRRKGFTPEAIKEFILYTGLSRINSTTDASNLDYFLMQDQKLKACRASAIIDPVEVEITNYDEGKIEYIDALNNMENEELGSHKVAFSRHIYIERDDFVPVKPDKKWKRLSIGDEVRLMNAYFIKATDVVYDDNDNIIKIYATYDPQTRQGLGFNERKPNGTIHFVEKSTALKARFNLFNPLILDDDDKEKSFLDKLNKDSWIIKDGYVEESLKDTTPETHYQFLRNGYFVTDKDSTKDLLVFNRTCTLKSSFNPGK